MSTATLNASIHTLDYFCKLTEKAFLPYDVTTNDILASKNGWRSLANLWEELVARTGFNIFSDVLSYIKWLNLVKKPPNGDYVALVQAASEELLANTPAYFAWLKHPFLIYCIRKMAKEFHYPIDSHPYCYSDFHHTYVHYELILKIGRYHPGYKRLCHAASKYIYEYKETFSSLLPSTQSWSADRWIDENNILDEILRVYNVDYRKNLNDYCLLFDLLSQHETIPKHIDSFDLRLLGNMTICFPGLLETIWNGCNTNNIIRLFLLAEKRAQLLHEDKIPCFTSFRAYTVNDLEYTTLSNSWLFSFAYQQHNAGTIDPLYANKVKRAIFNVSMRL